MHAPLLHGLRPIVAALALCSAVQAQSTSVFDLVPASSNFTWSGTSTLGNIVGNPSNTFHLEGTTNLDVVFQSGAQPFASAAFSGGAAAAVPDIHGRIDSIPGFPPLATIDVLGLVLSPTSPSVTVGAGGAFSASISFTALSGTLVVDTITGAPTSTDLTGAVSNPTSASGTLTVVGGALRLNVPVNSTFAFSDPTSGASGSITLVGTVVGDHPLVRGFCAGDGSGTACPCGNSAPAGSGRGCLNSGGVGALLAASGAAIVSADTFVLTASSMPATGSALFFQGTSQASAGAGAVFGDGKRCAAGSINRLGTKTNAGGSSSYPVAGDPPVSVQGAIPALGGTRTYQVWYRNSAAFCTTATFNLTNGVQAVWLP
jgi:hypothetical protein